MCFAENAHILRNGSTRMTLRSSQAKPCQAKLHKCQREFNGMHLINITRVGLACCWVANQTNYLVCCFSLFFPNRFENRFCFSPNWTHQINNKIADRQQQRWEIQRTQFSKSLDANIVRQLIRPRQSHWHFIVKISKERERAVAWHEMKCKAFPVAISKIRLTFKLFAQLLSSNSVHNKKMLGK